MKIAIDLDRTIFDCSSLIFSLGNKFNTNKKADTKLRYKEINPEEALNYSNALFFLKMSNPENFYKKQNSTEVINNLKNQGHEITLLSSRPNCKSFNRAIVIWLKEHNVNYDKLIISCTNKPFYCVLNNYDLLIDDTLQNCIQAQSYGIPSIWYINEYNYKQADNLPKKLKFSATWDGIEKIVHKINQNYSLIQNNNNNQAEQ